MKLKLNKNRPTDRVQIDPRVVIGVALPAGYRPGSGSPAPSEHESPVTSEDWRGIHGGVPL